MKAIIRLYVKQFFTGKFLFLLMGCLLFSLGERQSTTASYEIYVLNMLTEHYYLTYMMIPTYLLFFYQSLGKPFEFLLIRTNYFWESFLARVIAIFIHVIGFVGIQVIVFLIVGLGLPRSNRFPLSDSVEFELASVFSQHFTTPIITIVIVTLFMIIGLATVSVMMLTVHHFFNEKVTLITVITLYIFMTFGIKIPSISQVPFVFINHYIIFHHNFAYEGKLFVTIVSMIMIYVVVFVLVKRYWYIQPSINWTWRKKGVVGFYVRRLFTRRNMLICLGMILVISLWKATQSAGDGEATFRKYFLLLFYGHGTGQFHLLSFLEMIIMNSVPLYLLAIFLEEESRDRNLAITIRLKKKTSWLYAMIGICLAFITFYVFSLVAMGSMVSLAFEFTGQGATIVLNTALLKLHDIAVQFLLMFLLYTFNRNMTFAFLGVVATNIMSIWLSYWPTGISSMARSEEMGGLPFMTSTSILLISLTIIWIYIRVVSYRQIFNR